ncbi:MAG: flagellar hook-associated protein 1 [Azoarcus sp.]|uniref:Flagellar hook-associated protein 1 n=1 Tax=Aromatoleum tolulyticum TaxID=34027 RepID=A0A1N7CBQ0_9RHOO|nr:flagellar hook-associated protein FlgK [Aromatoleum tolulyticum]MCK9985104.1 flagellar hook-associated protein 1 [Azoarcus sp.]SIR60834.1 flagellar hook-associated protein 1 FlgK [Aromatoleum tolulyticum]
MAGLLSIGLTGINSSQANLLTTSHNITNANTPGFNRQTTILTTADPFFSGAGFFGQGVEVDGVRRQYDQFLSQQVLNASARKEEFAAYNTQISQIDNLLADTSSGLSPALADFFAGVQDVATNPSSLPARQALISSAESLASRFNALDTRLSEIRDINEGQIVSTVDSINAYARQISDINERIALAQVGGTSIPANDLLDQRDNLVAELNKLVKVSTTTESDGSLSVFIGSGQPLVVGTAVSQLVVEADSSVPSDPFRGEIRLATLGGGSVLMPDSVLTGGQLGGMLRFRNETLNAAREQLGDLAIAVASEFNTIHAAGYDLDGTTTGIAFFKDLSSFAATDLGRREAAGAFAVVLTDPRKVAASGAPTGTVGAGGSNNENALRLAALQTEKVMNGDTATFQSAYAQLVSFVGNKTREVQIGERSQESQLQQAIDAQQALSGVNLDEEAANLIRFQQSYQAAARVMSVAGTLFDEILSISR